MKYTDNVYKNIRLTLPLMNSKYHILHLYYMNLILYTLNIFLLFALILKNKNRICILETNKVVTEICSM